MPQVIRTDTHTGITAEHERKLRRHAASSGFDPNADPIIIGLGAADHTGDVGEIVIGNNAKTGDPAYTSGAGNIAIGYGAAAGGLLDDDDANIAIGQGTAASGGGAVAIGSADARSAHTVAIGGADALDTDAIAIGRNAHAYNPSTTALGVGSHANSDSGTALGMDAGAIGVSAVALGANAAAGEDIGDPADYAVAIGSASAWGTESIAIGRLSQTTLTATGGVAIGKSTYANGVNSTAVGCGARAGDHELVLGTDTENVIMPGAVAMPGLPTADPLVSGAVWNDGGVLTVSP